MSQPLLDHVERDAGRHGGHAEAVPQTLGADLRPFAEVGGVHDGFDFPPGRGALPGPELDFAPPATFGFDLPHVMHQVQGFK